MLFAIELSFHALDEVVFGMLGIPFFYLFHELVFFVGRHGPDPLFTFLVLFSIKLMS